MTIQEYDYEYNKLISEHADKAVANFNEFKTKSDEQLKSVIELAISRFVCDFRILDSKTISKTK